MPDAVKVYLVTSGSGEDYGIEAVFYTREKAEKYVLEFDKTVDAYGNSPRIEEWLLDEDENLIAKQYWKCLINVESGALEIPDYGGDVFDMVDLHIVATSNANNNFSFICVTSYISLEHAKGVAVEHRQARLRGEKVWEILKKKDN
jgi:hypothetical protein